MIAEPLFSGATHETLIPLPEPVAVGVAGAFGAFETVTWAKLAAALTPREFWDLIVKL